MFFYPYGVVVLTALFVIYMTYEMFESGSVMLIVKMIVSFVLFGALLYCTDIFLQKFITINIQNNSKSIMTGCLMVYLLVSIILGCVATYIANKLIDLIYSKLILPCWNKHKKIGEILPFDPDCKIIIRFNNSDDTYFNISIKCGIIPSDIKLTKIGTDTYVDKDENTWRPSVYACENIFDERRLRQIVRAGMIEILENNL